MLYAQNLTKLSKAKLAFFFVRPTRIRHSSEVSHISPLAVGLTALALRLMG